MHLWRIIVLAVVLSVYYVTAQEPQGGQKHAYQVLTTYNSRMQINTFPDVRQNMHVT